MSVSQHEAFCLDSFQDSLLFWDDFEGDQLKDEWYDTGTGSAAVVDGETGGIVRIASGATSGNEYYIDWRNYRTLLCSKNVTIEFRIKISSTSDARYDLELGYDGTNRIRFRYDTALGHTNWMIECLDGGASTLNDSGVAPDTDEHIFRIETSSTSVSFYIDGVEVSNSPITTNIGTDYWQPVLRSKTYEDVAKSMDIDYIAIRQER